MVCCGETRVVAAGPDRYFVRRAPVFREVEPYLSPLTLALANRIDPNWTLQDGCCDTCLDALQENAYRAERATDPATLDFRRFHRYVLDKRERIRWYHRNDDLKDSFRQIVLHDVAEATLAAGMDEYIVVDGETEDILSSGRVATN